MTASPLGTRSYQAFAERIRRRDRFTCQICGALGARFVDHIVPRHLGGAVRDPGNVRTLCAPCNLVKGGSMMTDAEVLAARNVARSARGRSPLDRPRATIFSARPKIL